MLFNSISYLIFLPAVVALYYATPHRWRWLLLLIASYFFYMCWRPAYAILLLISTGIAYYTALGIGGTENIRLRRVLLWTCITLLLGILFAFKYFNFATTTLHGLFAHFKIEMQIPYLDVLLPIGISFYTFQKISYVVDVYHREVEPEKHFGIFAVYSCFFPQLVAGPIERPRHLLPQFRAKHSFSRDRAVSGLRLILWGLFKKVAVADRLAILVESVYSNPHENAGAPLIVATVFFAFQIYCDFSGYSDIAIGSARLLGFELMLNFRQPYFAKSIPEFWRRWHISLSSWFRDYVYIPMGGSRVPGLRWRSNLFITFVVSGLWHGASWNFALWGAIHGLFMVASTAFKAPAKPKASEGTPGTIRTCFMVLATFTLVCISWIPFRAAGIHDSWFIFTHLFSDVQSWSDFNQLAIKFRGMGLSASELGYALVFIGVVLIYDLIESNWGVWPTLESCPRVVRWALYYAVLIGFLFFSPYNRAQNFIYFQF